MKLQQIHDDIATLEEGILQRAVGAAAIAIAALYPSTASSPGAPPVPPDVISQLGNQKGANPDQIVDQIVDIVSKKYRVNSTTVEQIVRAAKRHEHPDFPKATDILAVIGVESSFNPQAVSKLKKDPARGVMQVRPGAWALPSGALDTIDGQIKHGSQILRQYYEKLGNKDAALHAYNVGLTNHRRSAKMPEKGNPRYAPKVNAELQMYAGLDGKTRPTPTR